MNKSTVEELEKFIFGMLVTRCGIKEVAESVHTLFNSPPRKPLSELHLDKEACREFYSEIMEGNFKQLDPQFYGVWLIGSAGALLINYNGFITKSAHSNNDYSHFQAVDKLRSLGYDVINPTDKTETK